ncbi:MAG: choice-of-anchor B family protein [Flavobacteriales bacterium]
MKKLLTFFLIPFLQVAIAQTPCEGGYAGSLPCNDYDLMAKFTPGQMGASAANDSWGWTDPEDGTEYAIIGLTTGTRFYDISDPVNPINLGFLDSHTSNSIWRDIKVYNNYAFIVSEAGGHGMQVFDLTRLRNVANPPENFTEDAHYSGFGSAHNIVINPDQPYAYVVGASVNSGGAHFVDISDPLNPVSAGGYSGSGYTHDAQVVTYSGPDSDYTGKEIYFGSNEDEVVIVDVTNKNNPQLISSITYSNVEYTHQGWLTEDQRYFLVGDELDEYYIGMDSRTIILDLSDLDNPQIHFYYTGNTPAIDHNGYVVGDKFYLANYNAGMRVIDISDIANQNMTEIGYFDTVPYTNSADFGGSWNVYPYFASGNIVISGDEGFHLVKQSSLGIEDVSNITFSISPNPAKDNVTISSKSTPLFRIEGYNVLGQKVINQEFSETTSKSLDISTLNTGVYLLKINNTTTKRLIIK